MGFFLQGKYNKRVLLCDSTCSRADRKGPNGVGVSVAVAVVKVSAPVAAGPNEDVALSGPTVGHSLEEGSGSQAARAIHGPAIVIRAPTGIKNTKIQHTSGLELFSCC